ncbi:uncharacterized protein TNCV_4014251 [Trichonephila clavipes]|nr:uncharacterized protein TNCV_4014251 [Trichonephila clavipes]
MKSDQISEAINLNEFDIISGLQWISSQSSQRQSQMCRGKSRGSGPAMEESENDVGSLEQFLLYADEHYLAGKLPLEDHLGKVLHGVEEYNQRKVDTLRFHASELKWTGYHRIWAPRPLHQL